MPMIEARALTRAFGTRTAVEEVSFTLDQGQILALLGPNGAGKTTTVRMLLGLIRPSSGSATVAGVTVPGTAAAGAELRQRAGLLTETPGMYDRLSAWENLLLFGRLYRIPSAELPTRLEEYLHRLGLWERRAEPVGTYSKGMKQRLAIVRAVFHDPQVVFFDEPTAGLDPESARDVRGLITSLKAAGRTILVCTHNLTEAAALADQVGVLRRRMVAFGPPASLGRATVPRCRIILSADASPARAVIAALSAIGPVTVEGTRLEVEVSDPERDPPRLVAALVGAGFGVRDVRLSERSLEEIYLDVIGDE
ncbi:MAG: ABC transporter ATP-binding protein [Gemmatimonadales bacterium]